MNTYEQGLKSEKIAAWFLRLKCYRILDVRYKTPLGEIDLIARRGKTLVFVEVKHRKTAADAVESITSKNQTRVTQAAMLYLQRHPEYANMDMRFDAVVFGGRFWPEHIPNAWGA